MNKEWKPTHWGSDVSEEQAVANKAAFMLIGVNSKGKFICEAESGVTISWKYVVPLPEPIVVPWTRETFPLEVRWLKVKRSTINRFLPIGSVEHGGFYMDGVFQTWKYALQCLEWVKEDGTRHPCGEIK